VAENLSYPENSLEPEIIPDSLRLAPADVTVLVIDDDSAFRRLVRTFLKDQGYRVFEASDGIEGMGLLASQPFDMLITDIVMPGQEGLSTIMQAHREFPALKILAVSGVESSSQYLRIAKFFGAQLSLQKPITRESLLETLVRLEPPC
jgi:CheY-like chemotaxis protein